MMHLCIFCPFSDQLLKLCWRYVVSGGPRIWGELIRSRQLGRASVWIWICSINGTCCCLATFGILVNLCHDDGAQQEICCPSHKSPQTAGKIFSPIFSSLIIIFWNQIDSLPFLSPYQCWNSFFCAEAHSYNQSSAKRDLWEARKGGSFWGRCGCDRWTIHKICLEGNFQISISLRFPISQKLIIQFEIHILIFQVAAALAVRPSTTLPSWVWPTPSCWRRSSWRQVSLPTSGHLLSWPPKSTRGQDPR